MVETRAVIDRIVAATNAHDLDSLVECFAPDYINETPAHPARGFRGRDQVRRNWNSIFTGIPDVSARVVATAIDGDRVWTEWDMRGARRDGVTHAMAGVIIFTVANDRVVRARFYLEPVETTSGGVDEAVERATQPS